MTEERSGTEIMETALKSEDCRRDITDPTELWARLAVAVLNARKHGLSRDEVLGVLTHVLLHIWVMENSNTIRDALREDKGD